MSPRVPAVSFRLPPEEVAELRRESRETGVPQARIVVDALRARRAARGVSADDDPVVLAAQIAALSARLEQALRRT